MWDDLAFRCAQLSCVVLALDSATNRIHECVGALAKHVCPQLRNIKHLQMSFNGCKQLSDVSALGESVGKLTGLQHLQMGFDLCSQLPAALQSQFKSREELVKALDA